MLCIISIQYPCRYDRILPLAIHHPELAEVGLGRARVLRLPVGRVTRDTWHYTRDKWHIHVTLYTCARDTPAPGTTSGGVLAPSTATAWTASSSPRCATETRIARTTWEPELQTIHRQSLQLYFAITVIPATLKVSLFRVTRRTAHTAPRVEPSSVRSRLNTGWSINMLNWC